MSENRELEYFFSILVVFFCGVETKIKINKIMQITK